MLESLKKLLAIRHVPWVPAAEMLLFVVAFLVFTDGAFNIMQAVFVHGRTDLGVWMFRAGFYETLFGVTVMTAIAAIGMVHSVLLHTKALLDLYMTAGLERHVALNPGRWTVRSSPAWDTDPALAARSVASGFDPM